MTAEEDRAGWELPKVGGRPIMGHLSSEDEDEEGYFRFLWSLSTRFSGMRPPGMCLSEMRLSGVWLSGTRFAGCKGLSGERLRVSLTVVEARICGAR